ncbi:MAG TPA: alanine/ornithine racemase family PLP-dependent enzyme [Candidatus Fimisoma avicola]|uniref:Alanine/ornithine racemase family PLP-dependent enzyme n=1 Tax=Candidatus Fimisoma avicola TaxID=2840826 RepID=A0A9D1L6Q3_9FIRM|nr:alanine/ornithine racemase family PLP-dependent enzyme [Candidatus Fimisoma avicola]
MENRYPRVEINLAHLQHNVSKVVEKCGSFGIQVAGVIKGATGIPEVARAFDKGGAAFIASSRLEQLEDAINAGIEKPMMLIRIPMLSEVKDVIRLADISLNSEFEVIKALNDEARAHGKLHKVILMADLGDLREGFWDKDEMIKVAEYIENKMINIQLVGIGTNVGCYGSISPTVEKLEELVELAEKIEERLGRQLEYISGGATSSLMRVWDKNIPKRINMLRVGEGILLARDLDVFYGYDMSDLYQDIFRLKAEVIEVKDKPSYPVGTIAIDAFGHTPTYVDRGIRRRALLAMGKVDYGDPAELLPMDKGIEVLGASSDHTIIDVEDAERDYKVGDIMTFDICYATVVYLTNCRNVHIAFV